MKMLRSLAAFGFVTTLAVTGCVFDSDDDDGDDADSCVVACEDAHEECSIDCDEDTCVASCDDELDVCTADCD